MSAPVFLGDELDGIGFRLAGLRSIETRASSLEDEFQRACAEAPLVILAASAAQSLRPEKLRKAILDARPPIAIVREISGLQEPPDMDDEVRTALGVAS